jgi:DNA ligase (NAD+)
MLKKPALQAQKLRQQLNHHDYLYHSLDQPEITDFEYDKLFSELVQLESEHPEIITADSPTQRAGGAPLDFFEKVAHRLPMQSLQNSYSPQDIHEFHKRLITFLKKPSLDINYLCELKFDGLAVELIYEHGLLTRALTRGDGLIGEDVTLNVKTIKNIPLQLQTKSPAPLLEVRGEVLIAKADFLALNEAQALAGRTPFANARNAAAGAIRQLDSKIAAQRSLQFFAHGVGALEGLAAQTQHELLLKLASLGLPVFQKHLHLVTGAEAVVDFYHQIENVRFQLPFDIDGIVVKVNSMALQDDLGLVARSPRWATAVKFAPEQAQTLIENIIVQVGRTGVLTPVAVMHPVRVGGVVVTHATLHNEFELKKKDVRIGDTVLVQRAGDVIPEVVQVLLAKRPSDAKIYVMPTACPSCGEAAIRLEEEVALRCVNPFCQAVLKGALKHFASRRAMNIDGVGDKLIDALVDKKLVSCFSDFYKLTKADFLALDRQGDLSSENALQSIARSKKTTLARLLHGLGIRYIGEATAKNLADHFGILDQFLQASYEELLVVPEIGAKVAQAILAWRERKDIKLEILNLKSCGFEFEQPRRNLSGSLMGKSFVITGTLPVKRDEAKDLIEKNGGKVLSSVSAKLNYLIAGDDPGSKIEKAEKLGVTVLSWDELLRMLS